ncbi:hypothetical protein AO269_13510 [Pseudomonas putida]|nr:hypothetical protein AO269_13510 [Pseudomonas putida]
MTDSPRIDSASKGANLVLVVEDEALIREFVCELLGEEGWKTEGGAGLANYSAQTWPEIPIMIMSGHETPESSGVTIPVSFVRKPWTLGQLLDGVEKALGTVPRAVS